MSVAEDVLVLAGSMMDQSNADAPVGTWPRAAAFLTRQALEEAVDEVWRARGVALERADARAQFLCLDVYLRDSELAARCRYVWAALSRACHHHPYELAPTASELQGWTDVVRELIEKLRQAETAAPEMA